MKLHLNNQHIHTKIPQEGFFSWFAKDKYLCTNNIKISCNNHDIISKQMSLVKPENFKSLNEDYISNKNSFKFSNFVPLATQFFDPWKFLTNNDDMQVQYLDPFAGYVTETLYDAKFKPLLNKFNTIEVANIFKTANPNKTTLKNNHETIFKSEYDVEIPIENEEEFFNTHPEIKQALGFENNFSANDDSILVVNDIIPTQEYLMN